ncbi:hypothetical protein LY76DRAFT_130399 [Colletotrichum caudatum]|nr:hypothetical protein LY76DRAFT_130399 [Colletotrichum caudatum]
MFRRKRMPAGCNPSCTPQLAGNPLYVITKPKSGQFNREYGYTDHIEVRGPRFQTRSMRSMARNQLRSFLIPDVFGQRILVINRVWFAIFASCRQGRISSGMKLGATEVPLRILPGLMGESNFGRSISALPATLTKSGLPSDAYPAPRPWGSP